MKNRKITHAIVVFNATSGKPTGFFELSQPDSRRGKVKVKGSVSGLRDGKHGLHVTFFAEGSMDCENFGPDLNALRKAEHGDPSDRKSGPVRHLGDLGNIVAEGGKASVDAEYDYISLNGPASIVGRGMAVYSAEDDGGKNTSVHADSELGL